LDNRKYTRLPINVVVEFQLRDGNRFYGETADLSLDGALVTLTPPDNIHSGDDCQLEFIIKSEDGWVRVAFACTVAHVRPDGVGFRFETAHAVHHESFIKLLIDGAPNVDRLLEELSRHPRMGFKFIREANHSKFII